MIPILYEATETTFTSNGIGRLSDAIAVKVNEVLNGLYILTMTYPKDGLHYDDLTVGRLILAKPNEVDQSQPFRIYKITKGLKRVTVEAKHISYDLSGYPVSPFTATGIVPALTGIVSHTMTQGNPFSVWTDITNTTLSFNLQTVQSFRACLGGVEGSILDLSQCEYKWDRFTVKAYANRGTDNGVTIRYGKNLSDFNNERNTDEASYTGCIAKWENDDNKVSGQIQYVANHSSFPTEKIFILDASSDFDEPPSVAQLNSRASQYMTANGFGSVYKDTLTVSFVQLWQTEEYRNIAPLERLSLGDTVTVLYDEFNVPKKVVEYTYDVLAERYDEMVLGNKRASFSQTITQPIEAKTTTAIAQAVSNMETAIQRASDLISGGLGGYVVLNTNADGTPNEILIMDAPNKEDAINVIRMNKNGIGFSTTGYSGQFRNAWTIDGHFVADFIDTGTLEGNLLRAASVLTSALEVNAYDAVTGSIENITYDGQGMHIARKDPTTGTIVSDYQSLFTELGMRVMDSNGNVTLSAEQDTVEAVNLTAQNFLRIADDSNVNSRFQGFYNSIHSTFQFGIFWEK